MKHSSPNSANPSASTPASAPLAITMGDPLGIGPEIIVKLAMDPARPCTPFLVIGDIARLQRAADGLGVHPQIRAIETPAQVPALVPPATLFVLQTGEDLPPDLPWGCVNARAGAACHAYIQRGIDLALAGDVSGLVTAPIHKEALRAAGCPHPGHTEMLAERSGTRDFAMMLANDELRVLLVSIHVPLQQAIASVTMDNELRAIRLAHQACRAFGIPRPRVAVAGLNPHAGEDGHLGVEERDIIAPTLAAMRGEGLDLVGPLPADTLFTPRHLADADAVLAMYHDQGLPVLKYAGFGEAANVTLGLPLIRTSVDHGTALDLAGSGRAEAGSLRVALDVAVRMVRGGTSRP